MYQKLIIPMGFVRGSEAEVLIEAGQLIQVAGQALGFSMAKIIDRSGDVEFLTAAQLVSCSDVELIEQLDLISTKRDNWQGIDFTRSHIMAILNVTPDSFSDGNPNLSNIDIEKGIDEMIDLGVSIIDVGGESTRPNADYIPVKTEIERVETAIKILADKTVQCSIDTRKAAVMDYALNHGADIINDVTALEYDGLAMGYSEDAGDGVAIAIKHKKPVILMHSKGKPEDMQNNPNYQSATFEIFDYLQSRVDHLVNQGFPKSLIAVDPGIGFGKTVDHNLELIKNIGVFHALGVPILLGVSRKSFLGTLLNKPIANNRLAGSLAVLSDAIQKGVQIVRVHDVDESMDILKIMHEIC